MVSSVFVAMTFSLGENPHPMSWRTVGVEFGLDGSDQDSECDEQQVDDETDKDECTEALERGLEADGKDADGEDKHADDGHNDGHGILFREGWVYLYIRHVFRAL